MKLLKGFFSVFIVMFFPSAIQAAPANPDNEKIAGQWQCVMSYMGNVAGSVSIGFDKNLQGKLNGQGFTYQLLSGGVLRMKSSAGENDYQYRFESDALLLSYMDGSTFDCKRQHAKRGGVGNGLSNVQQSNSGTEWQLQGTFCNWSGSSSYSSSYSSTRSITFDGRGRWVFGSQSSFSGDAGIAYGGSGAQDGGSYRVEGSRIIYRSNSGDQGVATVNIQQDDGRITEIYLDGALYSPSLCQ